MKLVESSVEQSQDSFDENRRTLQSKVARALQLPTESLNDLNYEDLRLIDDSIEPYRDDELIQDDEYFRH